MTRGTSFPPSDYRYTLPAQDAPDRPAPRPAPAAAAAPPAADAPREERGPVAMSHTQHALLRQWDNDNQPINTPLANSGAALDSSSSSQPTGAGQGRTIEYHLGKAGWNAWAEAGGASGGNRPEAINRMTAWLAANRPEEVLDLSDLGLTSLPENLPASLQTLNVSGNQLTRLPENLPASLQNLEAFNNQLTSLPENLPASLQNLDVSFNHLTRLPENLPASLQNLDVSGNQLTRLPENLPASLQNLDVSDNRLTRLPRSLPASLQNLDVSFNHLTRLPRNLPASLQTLDVFHNQLTRLPENLPASLQEINASRNHLTHLPENLPASLQKLKVSGNQLTRLPESLPASLQTLDAFNNQLTSLPENLPASLQNLKVSGNQLTSLPETLPASLQKLDVSDNQLTSLPENLPASFQKLNVSGNQLARLPDLPQSLQALDVSHNRLTRLPDLPQSLRQLDASSNPLTSVPENILTLSNECAILLNASHLSEAVRNRLAFITNAPGYNGPDITYAMGRGSSTPGRPLPEEVILWRQETGQTDFHDWSAFHAEPNAQQFSRFLGRLRETSEYLNLNSRPDFQQRVRKLLIQLQGDEALRATCFNLASDAVNTCGDRVALRMLDMETVCLDKRMEADIESGVYDHNPQALVDHCKGKYRQQIVADAASEKIKTMNFRDEIEVMLGFTVAFNTEFKLPVQMNTMLYPGCSGITAMDLLSTRKKLTNQNLTDQKLSGGEQKVLALAERIMLTGVEQTNLTGDDQRLLTGVAQPELFAAQENALKKGLVDAAKEWKLTDAGRAENNRSFHEFLANADVMQALLKRHLPQEMETLQGKIAAAIERKTGELHERLEKGEDATSLKQEFDNVKSSVTASVNKELIAGFIESRSINADLD